MKTNKTVHAGPETSQIESILDFWFGPLKGEFDFPVEKAELWFEGDEAFNESIRKQFGEVLSWAQANKLESWQETPRGTLALLILLDQFTRNLNEDAQAFASDALALKIAEAALKRGYDLKLKRIERAFMYLPFEHSEELSYQKKSIQLFENLCKDVPREVELPFLNMLDYARQHFDIVKQFGRFPHRNKVLGRPSTEAELEFLKQPNSSF